jgi:ribose 5-phosphate isomerase B
MYGELNNTMKIGIANDHAGCELKRQIVEYLKNELNISAVNNFGADIDKSVDYPDYAKKVVAAIESKNIDYGILICGSGIGMSICANRNKYVRAALCNNSELAKLSREHNDANVLVLGARYIHIEEAKVTVKTFLTSKFQAGKHLSRIDKL